MVKEKISEETKEKEKQKAVEKQRQKEYSKEIKKRKKSNKVQIIEERAGYKKRKGRREGMQIKGKWDPNK